VGIIVSRINLMRVTDIFAITINDTLYTKITQFNEISKVNIIQNEIKQKLIKIYLKKKTDIKIVANNSCWTVSQCDRPGLTIVPMAQAPTPPSNNKKYYHNK